MTSFEARHSDLVSLWEDSRARFGERPLFGTKRGGAWEWITYAQFADHVDRCRGGLAALGVGAGDRVAVISNNRVEWAVGAYATYGLGAAWVPMYQAQQARDWQFILGDCGARVVFAATRAIADKVEAMRSELPALEHVVCLGAPASDPTSWEALLARGATNRVPSKRPAPADLAAYIYTAGTTGRPKGVLLTHANLATNVDAGLAVFPLKPEHRSLSFLPWAHAFGHTTELHTMIGAGGSLAIAEGIPQISANLGEVKPSVLFAVPSIFNGLHAKVLQQMEKKPAPVRKLFAAGMAAASKERRGGTLTLGERVTLALARKIVFSKIVAKLGGNLEFAICGGAALAPEVAEFIDNLGIMVCVGYGLSETSPVIAGNTPFVRRTGSVGKPIPGVRVEIDRSVTEQGEDVGEIVVYGHNVMRGYHHLPEENAHVFTPDGGLRTGDLGHVDADGFLFVTGRIKELYKLANGKYVDPAVLERQLQVSPFIQQAFVSGADRPSNVAVIVPDWAAVQAWAKERGLPATDVAALAEEPRVRARIEEEIRVHSADWKRFERIGAFLLATEPFSVENDLLTPKLSLKRRNLVKRYEAELAALHEPLAGAAPRVRPGAPETGTSAPM